MQPFASPLPPRKGTTFQEPPVRKGSLADQCLGTWQEGLQ